MRWLWLLTLLLFSGPAAAQPFGGTVFCNNAAVYDASNSGLTQVVGAAPTGGIFVCGYVIASQASVNAGLSYGQTVTTACDTNTKAMTPLYHFAANAPPIVNVADNYTGLFVPPGNNICVNASAGSAVQAVVYYYQQKQ